MRTSERIALTGLLILGLTALATGRYVASSIETQVEEKAVTAIQSLEITDISAQADGINITLSGRVEAVAERDEVIAAIRTAFNHGHIVDHLLVVEPLVDLRPAVLHLQKDEQSITLTGEAPNTEARELLAARIERANLDMRLLNLMKAQNRRASSEWLAAAEAAIDAVVALEVATVTVEHGILTVDGAAADAKRRQQVLITLQNQLHDEFELRAAITSPPPFFSPYIFSIRKNRAHYTLEHCAAPDAAQQSVIHTALNAYKIPLNINKQCIIANGAPNQLWSKAIEKTLESIQILSEAEASIIDDNIKIMGFIPKNKSAEQVTQTISQGWPSGYNLTLDIRDEVPVIIPFSMSIIKKPGETRLTGYTPSLNHAENWANMLDATNQLELARGAPKGWIEAVTILTSVVAEQKIATVTLSGDLIQMSAPGDSSVRGRLRNRLQTTLPQQFRIEITEAKAPRVAMAADPSLPSLQHPEAVQSLNENADPALNASKFMFVAKKISETEAAVMGVAGDDAAIKVIQAYAEAKLGSDALHFDVTARTDALQPVGWQRVIFAALDALAHLKVGEAIAEEGALYLRGVAKHAEGARQAVLAAKAKTPENFTHFSWIKVREDARSLARAELAATPLEAQACLAAVQQIMQKTPISFEPGQAKLSTTSVITFDALVLVLKRCSDTTIEISGHTDNQGGAEENMLLSRQRASAVRFALIGHGIDANRLKAVGYGAEKPIANNETEAGRIANRRIEFAIAD